MNKIMYPALETQWKVMIVGGPNSRTDYHIEEGEEWFYMVKGDMVLKIDDGGVFRDVIIKEGEGYLHPAKVPHSPQRFPDTIGLVIERKRDDVEIDALRWYCPNCRNVLHEEFFYCYDLGSQLKPVIERYYSYPALRTCGSCGTVDQVPEKFSKLPQVQGRPEITDARWIRNKPEWAVRTPKVNQVTHPPPSNFRAQIDALLPELKPPVANKMLSHPDCQFKLMVVGGPNTRTDFHIEDGEEWFWQLKGEMNLKVVDQGTFKDVSIKEGECFLLPGKVAHSPQRFANTLGLVIERQRHPHELDTMRWYCEKCSRLLHEESFYCSDLGTQLVPVAERYASSEAIRTCKNCNTVNRVPGNT